MGSLRQRLERLERETSAAELSPFRPMSPADRDAWPSVSETERDRLADVSRRMGNTGPILVTQRDGQWLVQSFNTPFGRACYCLKRNVEDAGDNAVIAWLETEASADEREIWHRLLASGWDAAVLDVGEARIFESMIDRMTAALAR